MTNVPIFEKQFKWFAEQNRLVSAWYQILDLRYERVKTKQIENENGKNNILDIKGNKFIFTAQKMKFSIKDFFSKCDQISNRKLRIGSHLVKKSLMENFIFCTVVDIRLLLGYIFPDFPWFF